MPDDLRRRLAELPPDDLPEVPDRFEQVRHRVNRRRNRQRVLGMAAAAVVAVLAVLVPIVATGSRPAPTRPAHSRRTHDQGQVIGFHGLELTVPASWRINATDCGTPVANTVVRDQGAVPTCFIPRRPGISSVEFLNTGTWLTLMRSVRQRYTAHRVRILEGVIRQQPGLVVVVPAVQVLLFVDVHPAALASRVIGSIRLVTDDQLGCPMRTHALYPPARTSHGGRLTPAVLPGQPTAVVICHYLDYWLASSALVTGSELRRLTHTLNTLPPGLGHVPAGRYLPSSCTAPDGELGTGFVLGAHYAQQPPLTLWAHIGFCGPLGITNGVRSGQLSVQLVEALGRPLHTSLGFPARVIPDRSG